MNPPFTLASWNVFQGLHHTSKRDRWVHNHDLEEQITSLDADVLVMPEAWRFGRSDENWASDMAGRLGYELHQWVSDVPSRDHELVPWRMVVLTRIPARTLAAQELAQPKHYGPGPWCGSS